jgi:hypothetical protein
VTPRWTAPWPPVSLEGSGLILRKAYPVLACPLDPQGRLDFLRGRTRLPQPLIMAFIEQMRARGFAVESVCHLLREQGVQVAARTYRAWKQPGRPVAARTTTDAVVVDALRQARSTPDGQPTPESLYGRRKMTALLRRRGLDVAHCTVDRLMRELGMQARGGARRHGPRSRAPAGHAPLTCWSATSPRRRPTGPGSRTSPTCAPGPAWSMSRSSWTCSPSASWAGMPW